MDVSSSTTKIMSTATAERGSERKRHRRTTDEEASNWTLGQSFNAGQRSEPVRTGGEEDRSSDLPPPPPFISKLPAAVANVEDVRSYLHSKRVTNYLVGSTLGEGSFAKVKEGFHVLVGEKVARSGLDTYYQPVVLLFPAGCSQDN